MRDIKVKEIMIPIEQYVKALHLYVMGAHQPLIAQREDTVTGVLCLGYIFEILRKNLLAGAIQTSTD